MTKTISTNAFAKINLYLDVVGRREDGYHNIESIMQEISLCDTVTLTKFPPEETASITVTCSDARIPTDKRNIVHKCATAFFREFGIDIYKIAINIEKCIPSAAGLGGGSSDGAAILKLLNELYETGASTEKLCEIGAKVGADIPFCLIGGTAHVHGIGEIMEPLTLPRQNYEILLVFPGIGMSTAEAYSLIDAADTFPPHTIDDVMTPLSEGKIPTALYNAFEHVILPHHPEAHAAHRAIENCGAVSVLMSGSGSTVFGLFDNHDAIVHAHDVLKRQYGDSVFICRPNFK